MRQIVHRESFGLKEELSFQLKSKLFAVVCPNSPRTYGGCRVAFCAARAGRGSLEQVKVQSGDVQSACSTTKRYRALLPVPRNHLLPWVVADTVRLPCPTCQVIISGQRGAADTEALLDAASGTFAPDKVVMVMDVGSGAVMEVRCP